MNDDEDFENTVEASLNKELDESDPFDERNYYGLPGLWED